MKLFSKCLTAAVLMSLAGLASCSNDDWKDVDGANPDLKLTSAHLQTEAGRKIVISGEITDNDGISTIDIICHALNLNKCIDIIDIYGEPLTKYNLEYSFQIQGNETGDDFDVDVIVTDIGGRQQKANVKVTLDGDFSFPVFTAAPDKEITVIIKPVTTFNLKFTVEDNKVVDYVELNLADITAGEANPKPVEGFPRRLEGNGTGMLDFSEKIALPNKEAVLLATITAYDKAANEDAHATSLTSKITVGELPDFEKLYLCDVATAADLNSDVFGVPMLIDHVGPYKYEARYYNEKAGTEICFLAQKTDFGPICFAPSADNAAELGDNPDEVGRIKLDKAGVYYLIEFSTKDRTYKTSTYNVADAMSPIRNLHYGADDLNTWWETKNLDDIWWQEWYFGPMESNPKDVPHMEQDAKNPHIFVYDNWKFEAGDECHFALHNWHHDGWWNFTAWRVDDSSDPDKFMFYGNVHPDTPHFKGNKEYFDWKYGNVPGFNIDKWGDESYRKQFVPDNWVNAKVLKAGTYKLIFDAHLERARLVPNN